MLTVLDELSKWRNEDPGEFDLDGFKIVYISPMKALVQEIVGSFQTRLKSFGIKVEELTGDSQTTKQQIAKTQIIVTTIEKWDVITRKSTNTSYTDLVRLVIIDEIHLLHNDRGPVLEAIIACTIRRMEQTNEFVCLVGLSATLPNFQDVATFLRVDEKKAYSTSTQLTGLVVSNSSSSVSWNQVCYGKVLDQPLVFVHSRKEAVKTANSSI